MNNDINESLLYRDVGKIILHSIKSLDINYEQIAKINSVLIINEIQKIIINTLLDDFEKIEEIINIFKKYGIDAGSCHDFGWKIRLY